MRDFRPRSVPQTLEEGEMQTLVALPGFELAQPRKKPIDNIITWEQCFSRYTAAMARHFPECTPGFMSHMLTVLKAYNETEFPGWREYDYAFRDKMASTGVRDWTKLDVHLYQAHCSSRPKQRSPQQQTQKVTNLMPIASNRPMIVRNGCAGITTTRCARVNTANSPTNARSVDTTTQRGSALIRSESEVATEQITVTQVIYL